MFETLTAPAPDKIFQLTGQFAADPRPGKVDLLVGLYRNADGVTPVMGAVKEAERRILEAQTTKAYLGFAGDAAFISGMRDLLLADAVPEARIAGIATVGGTSAMRQILELVRTLTPDAQVWVSDPSWPIHAGMTDHLGLARRSYRYLDRNTNGLDRDGMMDDLRNARAGDVIVLHGCCHNPTGADLTLADWEEVAAICLKTGAIPLVDMAYQGFGAGLVEDAAGTRLLAQKVPTLFLAASCSKNFGLYRERAGVALIATSEGARAAAQGHLTAMNRNNFSFPPDHGARCVDLILHDADLRQMWDAELTAMRDSMTRNRRALADALRAETGSDRFGFFAAHQGMFSLIGASPAQVAALREDHGIYVVGDGRMNVAGLTVDNIPKVARGLAAVLG
ncbi:aspartate/tyrosine/aromatic aminotransferase [Rhodobacteraceae bacterium N5(2021)]|uniref:Aminotransferase n=1 Tax=Gymnodinialimonas phycosphaerae TaxID=2841589 RepID=A0A975YEX7_9RHOB|nr:amino acid aminotransferase [Gymnodinialimonas phycosphaerae]MBY4894116.1 aspartate/tyrosine/aromatic aminotransferase [Gymnodinialimonas phycosphaerae]